MEAVSSFLIVVATVVLGLVVFSLFSVYSVAEYSRQVILNEARSYAEGLYYQVGTPAGDEYPVVIKDFNYNGTLYLYFLTFTPSEANSAQYLTPPPGSGNTVIYSVTGQELYQGQLPLMKYEQGTPVLVQNLTVVWVIANVSGGLFRIGEVVVG